MFRFLSHCGGSVGPLFALSALPVLLGFGLAVDYARLFDARTELAAALDGAAIAAAQAENKSDAEREQIARDYLANNFTYAHFKSTDIKFKITSLSVDISAEMPMPTIFMNLGGISMMDLTGSSEVARPAAGKVELVLVLDYSGSMNSNHKYQRMADAATEMIGHISDAVDSSHFKVGLVPFSAMVHTTMSASYVNQSSPSATWTGCTQDRAYPYNITVETPNPAIAASKWGYIDGNGENNGGYGCAAYQNRNLKIVPLTSDVEEATEKLEDMRPLGNTNIPLGAEFGWNLLDPAAPFTEAVPYTDLSTRKYLVLLTDGVQTSSEFGNGGDRSVPHAQANLVSLCDGMRSKGITVFTIAYDVTDPDVTDLLKQCAPGQYYEPSVGGSEISAVFNQITSQIMSENVRLTK